MIAWTEERTDTLIRLWNEGISAKEIARQMNLSTDQVTGKVCRLGLPRGRQVQYSVRFKNGKGA